MRAGLLNQAAAKIAAVGDLNKAELTELDVSTRDNLLLVSKYLQLRDRGSDADHAKLECELGLGGVIQSYEELAKSDVVKKALAAPDPGRVPDLKSVYDDAVNFAQSEIRRRAAECGVTKVEPTSWFIVAELAGRQDQIEEINRLVGTSRK